MVSIFTRQHNLQYFIKGFIDSSTTSLNHTSIKDEGFAITVSHDFLLPPASHGMEITEFLIEPCSSPFSSCRQQHVVVAVAVLLSVTDTLALKVTVAPPL